MNWKWDDWGTTHALYADESGKIVGEVKEGWRSYEAWAYGQSLGEYLTKPQAMDAVVRNVRNMADAIVPDAAKRTESESEEQ